MAHTIRSFKQRLADADRREAMSTVTMTERLLSLILIELKETRRHRKSADHARTLQGIGFSREQAAAILGTTAASLGVLERRDTEAQSADAVDPHDGETHV
jgi:hypothetical protein